MGHFRSNVEKYFSKKRRSMSDYMFKEIFETVETFLNDKNLLLENERQFKAEEFYDTMLKSFKPPSEQAGKLGTEERDKFARYISQNIHGATLGEKVESVNRIARGEFEGEPKIAEILASLGAIKILQQTLDDFNESTAGFIFESFLAALLQGKQITEKIEGSLPIEDCFFFLDPKTGEGGQPVSLKLLGSATKIHGSLSNLLSFFRRPAIAAIAEEKGIEYLVGVKQRDDELDLFSFTIKPSNFFFWISEENFDFKKLARLMKTQLREEVDPYDFNTPEAIEAAARNWETLMRDRSPMFGIDSAELQFNYNWGEESLWRKIFKVPPLGKMNDDQKKKFVQIMLSDESQQLFDTWRSGQLAPGDVSSLDMPPEIRAMLSAGEEGEHVLAGRKREWPDEVWQAVKILHEIAKKRLQAFFIGIEYGGHRLELGAIHVQRYFAQITPGDQYVSATVVEKLYKMVEAGRPEDIIRWSEMLEDARIQKQFHIHPIRVRARSTLYGSIKVSKRFILIALQKYSELLRELVGPIYKSLSLLTDSINGFYLENKPGEAFNAADHAGTLHKHTQNLKSSQEKE